MQKLIYTLNYHYNLLPPDSDLNASILIASILILGDFNNDFVKDDTFKHYFLNMITLPP